MLAPSTLFTGTEAFSSGQLHLLQAMVWGDLPHSPVPRDPKTLCLILRALLSFPATETRAEIHLLVPFVVLSKNWMRQLQVGFPQVMDVLVRRQREETFRCCFALPFWRPGPVSVFGLLAHFSAVQVWRLLQKEVCLPFTFPEKRYGERMSG